MKTEQYIYLNRKAVLAAMLSATFPVGVYAAAGKVQFASGGATVKNADGVLTALSKGMDINQGDTILTGAGRAQVKFTDGGYMSFQPNTQFKVEEYNYNGTQDGTEKGFFKLVEGGLRAITGLVGRNNRPAYRMSTPVATIGIRGSYFLAEFKEKLKTHVGQGSIFVFNDQGNIILFQGQGAVVEPGAAPSYSDEQLTLGAKGPEGGQPSETQQQQLANSDNNNVFKVSEQYNEAGVSTSVTNANGISAVIANLNGINAEGIYLLDPNVVNTGTNGFYNTALVGGNQNIGSVLSANFESYVLTGIIKTESTQIGNPSTFMNNFSVSGAILPSGSFGASGSDSYGGICYGTCTLNLVGAFAGAQAERAGINYTINGASGGLINGSAGFIANPPPAPSGFGFGN